LAVPLRQAPVDLRTAPQPDAIGQHEAGLAAAVAVAVGGPEVGHHQGLQLTGAAHLGQQLGPIPALGLGVPLAPPDDTLIDHEGVGGAVAIVDELQPAGGGHGGGVRRSSRAGAARCCRSAAGCGPRRLKK
jgi:hypothetical protein